MKRRDAERVLGRLRKDLRRKKPKPPPSWPPSVPTSPRSSRSRQIPWLQWGGVDPSRIVVDVLSAADIMVCEPHHGYTEPQWRPAMAAKAGELLRQLCLAKGYRVYFDGAGQAHITWRANLTTATNGTYGAETGGNLTQAAQVESLEDFGQAVNRVLIIGKSLQETPDSKYFPPYYEVYQPDALTGGTPSCTGNFQSQVILDENLRTTEECAIMGWNIFGGRDAGLAKYNLLGAYAGYDRWPGEYVLVQDPMTVGIDPDTGAWYQALCRVREVTTKVSQVTLETTMIAETLTEVDAGV